MYSLDKTLVEKFRKQIQSEIDSLRYSVSQGVIEDIITYKQTCARIEGFESALSVFNDILSKLSIEETEN